MKLTILTIFKCPRGLPWWSLGKMSDYNAGDPSSISRKIPLEENGNPL